MPQDLSDDKSTLVQVVAWCRQATSHYLSQCWPSSMSPYGITRPQWVKLLLKLGHGWVITSHCFTWMWWLIHALVMANLCQLKSTSCVSSIMCGDICWVWHANAPDGLCLLIEMCLTRWMVRDAGGHLVGKNWTSAGTGDRRPHAGPALAPHTPQRGPHISILT